MSKLDPSLMKIANSNKDIKTAIEQAKSYLTYILEPDYSKIDKELNNFITYITRGSTCV